MSKSKTYAEHIMQERYISTSLYKRDAKWVSTFSHFDSGAERDAAHDYLLGMFYDAGISPNGGTTFSSDLLYSMTFDFRPEDMPVLEQTYLQLEQRFSQSPPNPDPKITNFPRRKADPTPGY